MDIRLGPKYNYLIDMKGLQTSLKHRSIVVINKKRNINNISRFCNFVKYYST